MSLTLGIAERGWKSEQAELSKKNREMAKSRIAVGRDRQIRGLGMYLNFFAGTFWARKMLGNALTSHQHEGS